MQNTFSHKVIMSIFAGFVAASLFWLFRHVVEEALWETSDAGWRQSLKGGTREGR